MSVELIELIALGACAGVLAGLFGVGGGLLFVPALVLVGDLSQIEATATSLAAMIPAVVVGALRQSRAGLVRWRLALVLGVASGIGIVGGVAIAESVPESALRSAFAVLLIVVAVRLVWSVRRRVEPDAGR